MARSLKHYLGVPKRRIKIYLDAAEKLELQP